MYSVTHAVFFTKVCAEFQQNPRDNSKMQKIQQHQAPDEKRIDE
jgi:hypothetical protein